jgi:hypothetical protein
VNPIIIKDPFVKKSPLLFQLLPILHLWSGGNFSGYLSKTARDPKAPENQQPVIYDQIGRMLADIDGIKDLRIQFDPYF